MAEILIADDEKEIVSLLKIYLEAEGFTVHEAFDGEAVIRILRSEKIDLLIVDIMMPQKNGYEVIKQVRGSGTDGNRLIPVLVISAKTEVSDRVLGLDLGADDYIPKPFEPLEVVAKVKAHLRKMDAVQSQGTVVTAVSGGATVSVEDSGVLTVGKLTLNKKECTVFDGNTTNDLTKVELTLLEMFMNEPRRVFTTEQIHDRGWAGLEVVDDNTIRVTISHIREKIECGDDK